MYQSGKDNKNKQAQSLLNKTPDSGKLLVSGMLGSLFIFTSVMSHAIQNPVPGFITGEIKRVHYDGITDDLASAGLGLTGLQGSAPVISDPVNPTDTELRRLAIYNNYRALVDTTADGGMGRLYGPNIKADGTLGQGLISGFEYVAYANYGWRTKNVTLMVQIPDSFDPEHPCIVTAPSSGSRGIYGAIGTAGDWGLKNHCAVAYTDAGKGTGAHNLSTDTVNLIDGTRTDAETAGKESQFTAPLSDAQQQSFNQQYPDRFAVKHAHSRQNPEKDWGRNVLQSIRFAFYALNDLYGEERHLKPSNTIVIASSISNGGGASIKAAEQDYFNLIDGVAVSEPNVNPLYNPGFSIVQGDSAPLHHHSKSLMDYTTLINVYQGCANLAPANATSPFNFAPSADACASLHDKGKLTATELAEQATEAQAIINNYGILEEQNILQPSHWFVNVPQAVSITYANAYGRFSVTDNLCGYSFAAVDANQSPAPLSAESEAILFSSGNGIPPTGGIQLINNESPGGAIENRVSTSPTTGRTDQNLDGALCLRSVATGSDPSKFQEYLRVRFGIWQVRVNGRLKGKPTIFVTGRSDAVLPPNHTSRAYFGLNQLVEGSRSNMHYYEVTNAHHLDAFNSLPGFNDKFIPLHHYYLKSLDLMYAHLKEETELPPSQVIRTRSRGSDSAGNVPPLDEATHLPSIVMTPDADDKIRFFRNQVIIPE